ncbi:glycerophosphodiester phosphodiesterase [Kineococcus xinjiangensis]|uniref:glycerophosphodiester phosphodiesterase n=1 Tax=Kineococcus xinjiangensis TaxID=512762 RepID=UPI001B80D957|nr:glycerophosphodiester phosphodiesterase family protein [Kineococcus xinjiangensis]
MASTSPVDSPLVIAHRGYSSVAPENTLAAFEAALRCGADMIETDLHPTADGSVVLIHDEDVDATTGGHGRVSDLAAAELASLDAGAWFSPAYRGQRVPLLADLLDLVTEHPGAQLLLELKEVWTAEQVTTAVEAVRRAGAAEQVVLQSFEIATLEHVRDVAPDIRRAVLLEAPDLDALAQGRALRRDLGVIACNPGVASLIARPEAVAELHEAGLAVWTWTVDQSVLWRSVLDSGVDGVITNRPDGLKGWLEARQEAALPASSDLLLTALNQGARARATAEAQITRAAAA